MAVDNLSNTKKEEKTIVKSKCVRLFDENLPLKLISEKELFPVDVTYETYGELSPERDNAILVFHALTGNAHATFWNSDSDKESGWWSPMIGPGKTLDTNKYFVICSNFLGSCYGTTGPASENPKTGQKFENEFPPISTVDLARVQKALLDYLKIQNLVAVIGGSLGAMVAWQFAVSYPDMCRSVIPIAGTPEASPWVIGLNEVARQAILLDLEKQDGSNNKQPILSQGSGLKLARMIAMITYRNEISFSHRFQRNRLSNSFSDSFDLDNRFQIENYLHHQGEKLVQRFDPYSYIILTKAMDWHDISFGFDSLEDAYKNIQAKILSVGIDTDRLFTANEMRQTVNDLVNLGKTAFYDEIKTPHGHDAFLIEFDQLDRIIASFLEGLSIKILKFGGTSIGSFDSIKNVIQIIKKVEKESIILVFSAFGNTTDDLQKAAEISASGKLKDSENILFDLKNYHYSLTEQFVNLNESADLKQKIDFHFDKLYEMVKGIFTLCDFSLAVKDEFLAHGELLSTTILCAIFEKEGLPAQWIDSRKIIKTDSQFTQAEPDITNTLNPIKKLLLPILKNGKIPIVSGFIASNSENKTTTLGRGGSDYTAALLGSLLEVNEVQIWTDVDGIMTADPSLVPDARPIQYLSFQEASELAYFGARVIHPKTIAPAMEKHIPVRILNTHQPERDGTLITPEIKSNGNPVKSIAYKEGMTLITIVSSKFFKALGFLRRMSEVFENHKISLDLVATTEVSLAVAVHEIPNLPALISDLKKFGEVTWQENQAVVCVVGEQIKQRSGIAGRIFSSVAKAPISMISQGGSEINISFVCDEKHLNYVVKSLHSEFFSDSKNV